MLVKFLCLWYYFSEVKFMTLGSGELRNFDSKVAIEVIEEVLVTDSGEILRV